MIDAAAVGRRSRRIETKGVGLHVVVEGEGPLLILLHGFPQSWYLWRNQIDPLIAAGFQVAIPDQRGYGASDQPADISDYNILRLIDDVVGIADALGQESFTLIQHDMGAYVGWHTALLRPDRVRAIASLSVPYKRSAPGRTTRQDPADTAFRYIPYFQEPGVAERELDRDVRAALRLLFVGLSGDAPKNNPMFATRPRSAGLLGGLVYDEGPLPWLSDADLDYYAKQYAGGFRGPINWYRNIDRNLELTPQLAGAQVAQPAIYIGGERDPTARQHRIGIEELEVNVPGLRAKHFIPGAGHWLQMERPAEVNAILVDFANACARP